jgi:hypothetical protein
MAASMAIQAPVIYQPLARKIAKLYLVNKIDPEIRTMVEDAAIQGAEWDVAAEFGIGFFQDILFELFQEMGIGAALSVIPIVGTGIAAYFDARIAATLTWRVGLCTALFYENGCEWFGNRLETYERARLLISGGLSPKTTGRFDFNSVGQKVPGLVDHQASLLIRYYDFAKHLFGLGSLEDILRNKLDINPELVEAVLLEVRRRRIQEGRPSAVSASQLIQCSSCGMRRPDNVDSCPHCGNSPYAKTPSKSPSIHAVDADSLKTIVSLLRSARLAENEIAAKLRNDLGLNAEDIRRAMVSA